MVKHVDIIWFKVLAALQYESYHNSWQTQSARRHFGSMHMPNAQYFIDFRYTVIIYISLLKINKSSISNN
jgi:hypothetical protein